MATLDNKSIKATLSAVVKYNDNPDKNLPPDGLARAAAYIRGEHSVERLYSRGHNGCSSNPELALQQFRASEALYRKKKGGAKESGMGRYEMEPEAYSKKFRVPMDQIELNENGKVWVEKRSTIAEHFFLSFPPTEDVPCETQCEIADKLCDHPLLRDFYGLSNRHWNRPHDHTHLLISNFSKDGSKKLALNNQKRNELRKALDRICALDYGLSVIDDPALRHNDPDREAFIRQLVDEGKVKVYVPADFERLYNNYKKKTGKTREYDEWMMDCVRSGKVTVAQTISTNREWDEDAEKYRSVSQAEAYRKWIAGQEGFIRERDKAAAEEKAGILLREEEAKKAKNIRLYFWVPKYKSSKYDGYYYAIRRYDKLGYHKPLLVLLIELIHLVVSNEKSYFEQKYPNANQSVACFGGIDWKAQNSYDAMRYRQEQGVRTPDELDSRLKVVGTDLSEARKGLAYYKKTVENGNDLYNAIRAFNTLEAARRKNGALTENEQKVWTEAYRIMSAYKCTEPIQIGDFFRRRQFAEKKVEDLEKRIDCLKKDYHDLKFISAHFDSAFAAIEQYTYSNADSHSLNDLIDRASANQRPVHGTSKENEKIF